MKKLIITLLFSMIMVNAFASEEGMKLDKAPVNLKDTASLQRGAKDFAQYCFSCHSAHFMRYNRIAKDLDMSEADVRKEFIFTRNKKGVPTKIGALMKVSMTDDYAEKAFNTKVPDLSVEARARGADWLYTYLRSFYMDPSRPTGMNNTVFPSVGMPNVVWELQGLQKAVYKTEKRDGQDFKVLDHLELVQPGRMTKKEYDAFAADLVNFMVYMGEPAQLQRKSLGWKVLLFLAGFFVVAYLLKKEYWKDVH
jgi:ubiquinol-cytochrome c reductase cytochrome c1 subunit